MTRVLIVDDSPGMRELLVAILGADPELEVAGVAADGEEAVLKTIALRPDVISMDLRMPKMDGLRAIRVIMKQVPTPIVVLYSPATSVSMDAGFNALRAGALEVVEKPELGSAEDVRSFRKSFGSLLKLMAEVKVVRVHVDVSAATESHVDTSSTHHAPISVVGLCSSTGGPAAIERVLSRIPVSLPVPILVVQHIAEGFLAGFVEWLNNNGPRRAFVASGGERPGHGEVYFAPDGQHLRLGRDGRLVAESAPPLRGHLPSGDVLFESLADACGDRALAVVLTGMGDDGARGARAISARGGVVIAQDEASSIVYGMPKAVLDLGVAAEVVPLDTIGSRVVEWVTARSPLRDDAWPREVVRPDEE